MSIPPHDPTARRPSSGLDPMPGGRPRPHSRPDGLPGDLPDGLPDELPDDVPDPSAPGRSGRRSDLDVPVPGRTVVVGTGREDRLHHVVDVVWGEVGDPAGLRARCTAPVERVVPGLGPDRADCPACGHRAGTGAPAGPVVKGPAGD